MNNIVKLDPVPDDVFLQHFGESIVERFIFPRPYTRSIRRKVTDWSFNSFIFPANFIDIKSH